MSPWPRLAENLSMSANFCAGSAVPLISVSAWSASEPAGIGTYLPICCPLAGRMKKTRKVRNPIARVIRIMKPPLAGNSQHLSAAMLPAQTIFFVAARRFRKPHSPRFSSRMASLFWPGGNRVGACVETPLVTANARDLPRHRGICPSRLRTTSRRTEPNEPALDGHARRSCSGKTAASRETHRHRKCPYPHHRHPRGADVVRPRLELVARLLGLRIRPRIRTERPRRSAVCDVLLGNLSGGEIPSQQCQILFQPGIGPGRRPKGPCRQSGTPLYRSERRCRGRREIRRGR